MKYLVEVQRIYTATTTVEADSEEEAAKLAKEQEPGLDFFDNNLGDEFIVMDAETGEMSFYDGYDL